MKEFDIEHFELERDILMELSDCISYFIIIIRAETNR
jgi:hypothetical protein